MITTGIFCRIAALTGPTIAASSSGASTMPDAPLAKSAPESCWSCGFLVRLNGSLSMRFGVCANGNANDDGRVVTLDHGCGAHSEVKLARKQQPQPMPDHVLDTLTDDDLETL